MMVICRLCKRHRVHEARGLCSRCLQSVTTNEQLDQFPTCGRRYKPSIELDSDLPCPSCWHAPSRYERGADGTIIRRWCPACGAVIKEEQSYAN